MRSDDFRIYDTKFVDRCKIDKNIPSHITSLFLDYDRDLDRYYPVDMCESHSSSYPSYLILRIDAIDHFSDNEHVIFVDEVNE